MNDLSKMQTDAAAQTQARLRRFQYLRDLPAPLAAPAVLKFRTSMGALSVGDIVADGVVDDTNAVMDYVRVGRQLPPGLIRITDDIHCTANAGKSPGMKAIGATQQTTTIVADYVPDNYELSGVFRIDTDAITNYTYGSRIQDLSIVMAPGRPAINAINLTAAWMVSVKQVDIYGMRHGIYTPLRSDFSAVSDDYQCFDLLCEQNFIRGCDGHGYNLVAGQSPAMVRIIGGQSILNGGNGVNITAGQFVIDGVIASYNHGTGIAISPREGPSRLSEIIRCEIQDNRIYDISAEQVEGLRILYNNLMSETYSAQEGGHPQNNTAFMRPIAHVHLVAGIRGLVAEGNKHRSAGGPIPTSNACYGYLAEPGALDPAFPSRFTHNDFGSVPPNGLFGNSTGFVPFAGPIVGNPAAIIVNP